MAMRQVVMESAMGIDDAGAAVLVGDDFGIDVERFGEVGAHVRGGRGAVLCEDAAAARR